MGEEEEPRHDPDEGTGRTASERDPEAAPELDRARRYLDLWERNLSFLALHGPGPGKPPRPR